MMSSMYFEPCFFFIRLVTGTGIFIWKARDRKWFKTDGAFKTWNTRYTGEISGCIHQDGYCLIGVLGTLYKGHRLAFMYMEGSFPLYGVDHEDGVKYNNRWGNIRAATVAENGKNIAIPKDNKSGRIGVGWHKAADKWRSHIGVGGKSIHLGTFEDFEDAAVAREEAEVKYGFHKNHGRSRAQRQSSGCINAV